MKGMEIRYNDPHSLFYNTDGFLLKSMISSAPYSFRPVNCKPARMTLSGSWVNMELMDS